MKPDLPLLRVLPFSGRRYGRKRRSAASVATLCSATLVRLLNVRVSNRVALCNIPGHQPDTTRPGFTSTSECNRGMWSCPDRSSGHPRIRLNRNTVRLIDGPGGLARVRLLNLCCALFVSLGIEQGHIMPGVKSPANCKAL